MGRTPTVPASPVLPTAIIGVAVALVLPLILAGCASTPSTKRTGEPAARGTSGEKPSNPSVAASGTKRGGGYYLDDGPGDNAPPDLDLLPDAIPRVEKYASGANRPYNVFGTDYAPDLTGSPYKQRGVGSWYGRKFHGQRTSSGEIYDMYAMTAAHPTLPIPCYALVTSVATGKSIIVRVNDRGPFLHNRIMDLSYAAAYKLGYSGAGSAVIEVEMLLPREIAAGRIPATSSGLLASTSATSMPNAATATTTPKSPTVTAVASTLGPAFPAAAASALVPSIAAAAARPSVAMAMQAASSSAPHLDPDIPPDLIALPDREPAPALPSSSTSAGYYLQLGAFRARAGAESFAAHLSRLIDPALASRVHVSDASGLYRVRVGPYAKRIEADNAASSVRAAIAQPVMVMPNHGVAPQ